jgi:hypothetical protein
MKYTVKSLRANVNVSNDHAVKMGVWMAMNEFNVAYWWQRLLIGDVPLPIIANEQAKELLGIECQHEQVFEDQTPILNRRSAINYANDLSNEYVDSGLYNSIRRYVDNVVLRGHDEVNKAIDYQLKLFTVFVCVDINGQDKVIARATKADRAMVDVWREEMREYKKYGHYIGADQSFITNSPFFNGQIEMLPDVADLWDFNNESAN